jgi:hypothetical protein
MFSNGRSSDLPHHPEAFPTPLKGQWHSDTGDLAIAGRGSQQRALSGILTRFPIIPCFHETKTERRHRNKGRSISMKVAKAEKKIFTVL